MFMPVSALPYHRLARNAQVLLVRQRQRGGMLSGDLSGWADVVAAAIDDADVSSVRDVVRDLLGNPQIRAVVFDGECSCREGFASFWESMEIPDWRIDREHIELVRRFVDLYDGEFRLRGPQQPFWPSRIRYL